MALSKMHIGLSLLAQILKEKGNVQKAVQQWQMSIPYYVLPDAIRCFGLSRTITHFEKNPLTGNVSAMKYPEKNKLKALEKSDIEKKLQIQTAGDYHQVAIGDESDINTFISWNSNLELLEFRGILVHLLQDIVYDTYIRQIIDCSQRRNTGKFIFNQTTYDAKSVRQLIQDIEEFEFRILVKKLHKYGISFNQAFFEEHVKPAFEEVYSPFMSETTWKYITFSDDKLQKTITSEQADKIIEKMLEVTLKHI